MSDDSERSGQEAAHPAAISRAGWWVILKRVWNTSNDQALWVAAAGVAFFGFYTLIPTLALLVLSYGLLGGGTAVRSWIQELEAILPDEAMRAIFGNLVATARGSGDQFGWGLAGTVLMLLWSALFGMRALMAALNNAYGEVETRGFLALNGLALLLGLGASVLVVASIGILTAGPALVGALAEQSSRDPSLGPAWAMAASVGRWPLVGVIIVVALSVCYRVAPCRSSPKWRWVGWGAVVASALWMVISLVFSFYVREVAHYEMAFGLTGAVLTMMIWLYMLAYAVLFGAALNAETERWTILGTAAAPEPGAHGGRSS
ncbi:YihY/virulence factor BrkB family protein [Skermanella mucosa]|uniref:YihY/virulence factor BrkB family protein n=1 Tax=Skermanella mucosa TaxID=1789672 RepID=UPI00192A8FED|nr:YihY/virulence factor BrkB family protein [Skermanella mucosa]UEM20650.1 YihY/virulence factor BrkB family protein [Skermanella mucosa]